MPIASYPVDTILKIALPVPEAALPASVSRVLDYLPCQDIDSQHLQPGIRVLVPYGRRKLIGILLTTDAHSHCAAEKLKPVIAVLDDEPVIDKDLLSLCIKSATYYHDSTGEMLAIALPGYLRKGGCIIDRQQNYWKIVQGNALEKIRPSASKQQQALRCLMEAGGKLSENELKQAGISSSTLKRLQTTGLITLLSEIIKPVPFTTYTPVIRETPKTLNREQQTAVNTITSHLNTFFPVLLHGITGSGKTEVYLQVVEQVLWQQKQALVLVPEIGLTPQTLQRFRQRFNVPVIAIHSRLNETERYQGWLKARQLEAGIIISTRSGIFTPLPAPGLIVVDEEHDLSYKQQESIRYSARDLALLRAKQSNIPVILGSATPSLESLNNAWQGNYHYLPLNNRAGKAKSPSLKLVDIRNTELHAGLSHPVTETIRHTLAREEQVLIFINRRGFAPSLICSYCGVVINCPHCDAHMTLHRLPPHIHCHHCDYQLPVPAECIHCRHPDLVATGTGTERTEMALQELFPGNRILRIDRDSTRKKNSLQTMLAIIKQNDPAILVGTQMLAKGHHFPNVTLVVILNADAGFFSTDFRGEEKTAQLLLQVSGRAGRSEIPGQVLIQTYNPDNPDLLTLIQEGYTIFAKKQLNYRKNTSLPPYTHLALFTAESLDIQVLQEILQQVSCWSCMYLHERQMTQDNALLTVLGPMPSPMEKKQNRFRGQLLFRGKNRKVLHHFLFWLRPQLHTLPRKKQCRWVLDIDPQETL